MGEQFKYNKLSIQNASYDLQDACELEKRCHRIQLVQLCHLNLNMDINTCMCLKYILSYT